MASLCPKRPLSVSNREQLSIERRNNMTQPTDGKKDLTKKDLIKILEKIDSERAKQNFKEYFASDKEREPFSHTPHVLVGTTKHERYKIRDMTQL